MHFFRGRRHMSLADLLKHCLDRPWNDLGWREGLWTGPRKYFSREASAQPFSPSNPPGGTDGLAGGSTFVSPFSSCNLWLCYSMAEFCFKSHLACYFTNLVFSCLNSDLCTCTWESCYIFSAVAQQGRSINCLSGCFYDLVTQCKRLPCLSFM